MTIAPAIAVSGLTKLYDTLTAVDDFSFTRAR